MDKVWSDPERTGEVRSEVWKGTDRRGVAWRGKVSFGQRFGMVQIGAEGCGKAWFKTIIRGLGNEERSL